MARFILLIIVFLLMTFRPQGQENNMHPDYRRLYQTAEKLYYAADANSATDSLALSQYQLAGTWLSKNGIYNDTLVDCYLKSGILSMSSERFTQALLFFQNSISTGTKYHLPDSLLFKPYLYAGSVHYSQNNLDSAIYYFRKAERINGHYSELNESERLFNKFGALYFEIGDYNKSISYFEKALNLVESKIPLNVFFVVNYKNNIATALMKLGRYNEALEKFREILTLGKPGDEILYNIANTYSEKGNDSEALHWVRQIRNLDNEKFNSLMKIFIHQKKYDSAGYYLSMARKLNGKHTSKITEGILLKYTGDIYAATGRIPEALYAYQRSIISLDPSFTDTSISMNPESFSGLQNFAFLFDVLMAKGRTLRFSGEKYLDQALDAYMSALSLSRHMEKIYFSDDSRLFLKNKVNPATRDAVDIAFLLYAQTKNKRYLSDAFSLVENNKATVLQSGLKDLELPSISGLPVELIRDERKYRTMLAKLNIQSGFAKDSLSNIRVQSKIRDAVVSLAGVQDRMDQNKNYHALKFYGTTPNIDSVQSNNVGSDEAILSYYYTDSRLICFYITKEDAGFTAIPLRTDFFDQIISLRNELRLPQASGRKYLFDAGIFLFKQLVSPVVDRIIFKKKLVIIPFNEISYVPFEMLVNPGDGSLLLKSHSVSYNYSTAFLSGRNIKKGDDYNVLSMAPFSEKPDSNSNLASLSASLKEIADLPGKKIVGKEASKERFIFFSTQYPILHLATHAVANDTNILGSYIEFYGTKKDQDTVHRLYEQEIYALNLRSTRLVILSACETGSGQLVNGEGIMSLSRAFSYAGCQSVVMSLWKADELSTSFICRQFHKYLQRGFGIDEALQKAKLDYLENPAIDDRYKNPAYWANLILIGNYDPVTESGIHSLWWVALIAGLVVLGWIAIKKRNQA